MPDPAKAFVSYSRKDADFVLRLCQDLRNAGGAIWLDQLDIQPGEEWDQEIQRGLADCGRMVAVLSPQSVASQNVMDEIGYALSKKKRIFPVLHQDCEVPYRLNRLHYADFRTDYGKGLRELLGALAEMAPPSDAPTLGETTARNVEHAEPLALPPPVSQKSNYYLLAAIAIAAILIWTVFGRRPVPPNPGATLETQVTRKAERATPDTPAQPAAKESSTTQPKKAPSSFRDSFRAALHRYISEVPSG